MNAKYISGSLLIALSLTVSIPAVAHIGKAISSIGFNGSIVSQIVAATAIVLVLVAVFMHELSYILALCPFAAPDSPKVSAVRTKSVGTRREKKIQGINGQSRRDQRVANNFPRNEQV